MVPAGGVNQIRMELLCKSVDRCAKFPGNGDEAGRVQLALVATMVKLIFNLSFTLTEPPPTFMGVMPWSVCNTETSPCARNWPASARTRRGKLTGFSTP